MTRGIRRANADALCTTDGPSAADVADTSGAAVATETTGAAVASDTSGPPSTAWRSALALATITSADAATKTTGLPEALIAERLLLEIAARARRIGL